MKVTGSGSGAAYVPKALSASSLIGDSVRNMHDENLGKVEELMIDLKRGSISYVVVSFGGFLGIGDKLFAVPWQAFQLDADRKAFILDTDKQVLENAPGFDKDNWPNFADQEWGSRIYSFYGYEPYWKQPESEWDRTTR